MKAENVDGGEMPNDDYRKKPRRPKENPAFARLVIKSRENIGMSQSELARAASISPRTAAQVEREGSARADVIIRIAIALAQPPKDWLALAGHKLSEGRIRDIQKRHERKNITPPFVRLNPKTQFDRMLERVRKRSPALMCSFVTSSANIYRTDLLPIFGEMFKAGLHLAIICPYPITEPKIIVNRERLSAYYLGAYNLTRKAEKNLRLEFSGYEDRINVFHPNAANGVGLVAPPLRITEVRPAFIRYGAPGEPKPRYELGAYLRYLDGRDDQWLEIYDGEGEKSAHIEETCGVWEDYCGDIIASWNPGVSPCFDDKKLYYWQRTNEGAPIVKE